MANEATPPSPNAIKNAVEHLHKEGVLSINVANNWHTRYAKRLRLVQLHSAMFHQQAERNYIDYHKEFTDKFILPYAI
jgi:phosphoribosylformimino-5-aminoimidazole carboxamide ribonucleotide (ProFAR) isomerase